MSNCIQVMVRRAPDLFILYSDAETPYDDDGTFDLIWTDSDFALNYTIYISNYTITSFNESVQSFYNFTPTFEWPQYRYVIKRWGNGSYYFKVVAFNEFGNFSTECLEIKVFIPNIPSDEILDCKETFEFLPQIILSIVILGLISLLIIISIKIKKAGIFRKIRTK